MVLDAILSFVVSLLFGALAIYVGASIVVDVQDYGTALWTALIGSLAWFVAVLLVAPLGLFPGLGWFPALVALVVYLAVVNSAYPGGWVKAGLITLVALFTAFVGQRVLATVGLGVDTVGVPGI
jgi:hypothetical protein